MRVFAVIFSLFTIMSAHSFEADSAKIIYRNLGKREQGYFYLQGGLVYEARRDIKGFLVYFKNQSPVAYYPVEVDFHSMGLTAQFALIEHDNTIRLKNFKGKKPKDIIGRFRGGKAGLSIMAGFKGAVAGNKKGIMMYDSSLKLSTLGIDLSYIRYEVAVDNSYDGDIPFSWDEVVR